MAEKKTMPTPNEAGLIPVVIADKEMAGNLAHPVAGPWPFKADQKTLETVAWWPADQFTFRRVREGVIDYGEPEKNNNEASRAKPQTETEKK